MEKIINNNMEYYCAYLRKSRKDLEAEAHGQGETLARHERKLNELANGMGIKISKFYKEVVSGETISSRPIMQELLVDVENGLWTGVLVVEVERLARGNTLDQGIVSNTFQYSDTKIVTPQKTYDPNNEQDEEYFEFGLFMSRREYKKINYRLHEGILESAKEGKHVGAAAPYGYEKYKLPKEKGYSLKIHEQEANIIKLIFGLYSSGVGLEAICKKIDDLGFKPKRSNKFGKSSISHILTNPVYIGKIKYTDKATIKKMIDGKIVRVKNENKNIIYVDSVHNPIIDIDTWNKVQQIRNKNLISRTKIDYNLKNPMASFLKCGLCGKAMSRITYSNRNDIRICCRKCNKNIGSNIDFVEEKLILALKSILEDYKLKATANDDLDTELLLRTNSDSIKAYTEESCKLKSQLNNTYDFLEQKLYTKEEFVERSNYLKQQIEDIAILIKKLEKEKEKLSKTKERKTILIPKIEKVIDCYYKTDNIEIKNKLLKSVLEKVDYIKVNPKDKEDFKLTIYPKLY